MPSLRGPVAVAVAVAVVALAAAGCGSGGSDTVRIGVLADCSGGFGSLRDQELAAAELPLLERGAKPAGKKPSEGPKGARVAGKPVELVVGCSEWGTYRVLIAEARRLVEKEAVDVLVGPSGESDGLVLRELAKQYPRVSFLLAESRAPETTLRQPAANLFRFQPDGAELAAGLGSYAYHDLGWRTAAVVADDFALGWSAVAGFVAEFCALGGRVVSSTWTPAAAPLPKALAARVPRGIDGVALIPGTGAVLDWSGFAKGYARLHSDVARHLILGPEALLSKSNRAAAARYAEGVVGGDQGRFDRTNAVWRRMQQLLAQSFPGTIPPKSFPAEWPLVVANRNAMEAVVEGLERSDGDPARLKQALAHLELDGPTGRIRLDANRQAIAPVHLTQVLRGAAGKPVLRALRVVPNVEQTFGGYFSATTPPPTRTTPACHRATPPPWASPG
jgi:branched-chain amino acid transport system substrate-binding protein